MAKRLPHSWGSWLRILLVLSLLAASVRSTVSSSSNDDALETSGGQLDVTGQDSEVIGDSVVDRSGVQVLVRKRRSDDGQMDDDAGGSGMPGIHVSYLEVTSQVFSHFATVTVESEVTHTSHNGTQEVALDFGVPKTALLVSPFTVYVDGGNTRMGQTLGKEGTTQWYEASRTGGGTAGRLERRPNIRVGRGLVVYTVWLSLGPHSNASFTLSYVEMLERRNVYYKQTLMLQPGLVTTNLSVTVQVREPLGFADFAYTLPGAESSRKGDWLKSSSVKKKTTVKAEGEDYRELIFQPTAEMQREFHRHQDRSAGMLTVHYSLKPEPEGGFILVQNDTFLHSLAPDHLPPMPMNILFVIDISSSMKGIKIQQARHAMLKILSDMTFSANDTFNIILFDDSIEEWRQTPAVTSVSEIELAKDFVDKRLQPEGGTDIHQALMKGLTVLLGDKEDGPCITANMIIFLTDGDPSSGVKSFSRIISDVTSKNNGRASIHSLGFGFDMKFDFLKELSEKNRGTAQRIDDNREAKKQLLDFYQSISSPVLCNITVTYSVNVVVQDNLTTHIFPVYYKGMELLVAGKTVKPKPSHFASVWEAQMTAVGRDGPVSFRVRAGNVQRVNPSQVLAGQLGQAYVYTQVASLLQEADRSSSREEQDNLQARASVLAHSHNFAMPMAPEETPVSTEVESIEEKRELRIQKSSSGGRALSWSSWEMVCSLLITLLILQ